MAKELDDLLAGAATTLVLHPHFKYKKATSTARRDPEARLGEAVGLAQAIHLDIQHAEVIPVREIRPSTLFGTGMVSQLKGLISFENIKLAIIDSALTPIQQRNLEKQWQCKVIDRTSLILEIFGERARTAEGRLQVELAALTYQRSRLVRSWTHLERQRGGLGFIGGPGEKQLEVDRRLIDKRIAQLKKEIDALKRTRTLHRKARKQVPYPIVALVGYTNAGKSTLFNRLTKSSVMAKDILFATLDPTMRSLKLPSGRTVILSDTVGFISDLPTQLIAAFRATLEEVLEADLLVHVRDISHEETDAQRQDVLQVLKELGMGEAIEKNMINALNKIDKLPQEELPLLPSTRNSSPISAITGQGIEQLTKAIEQKLATTEKLVNFVIDLSNGAALAWLYAHGTVTDRHDQELKASIKVRMSKANIARFKKLFDSAQ